MEEQLYHVILMILLMLNIILLIWKLSKRKDLSLIGVIITRLIVIGALWHLDYITNYSPIQKATIQDVTLIILIGSDVIVSALQYILRPYHESIEINRLNLALVRMEAKYATLLEDLPVSVYMFHAVSGKWIYINKSMKKLLNVKLRSI